MLTTSYSYFIQTYLLKMENPGYETRPVGPDISYIRGELNKILESSLFSNKRILRRFLNFVVEHKIAGKEYEIKEYTIALAVLGKTSDFDPARDASVRIHANRLRKMLDQYYRSVSLPVKYRIHLPTGNYKPVFIPSQEIPGSSAPFLALIDPDNHSLEEADSVCILPFSGYIPGEHSNEIPGKTFEILHHKLSLFQDISVIPVEKPISHREERGNTPKRSKTQGAKFYLSGNVDLVDNKLHISADLFRTATNEFMVSLSFQDDIREGNYGAAIENITSRIASSLADYAGLIHLKKPGSEKMVTQPGFVSHAVSWYYRYLSQNNREIFYEALAQMEDAVHQYPGSALSNGILSHLLSDGILNNYLPPVVTLENSRLAAERSLRLNPGCQHAHISMGWIMIFYKDAEKAICHFKRSVEINPHSTYFKTMAAFGLSLAGDYKTSLPYLESALALNPFPGWWLYMPIVFTALKEGDYPKMLFYSKKITTVSYPFHQVFEMIALNLLGKKNACLKIYNDHFLSSPGKMETVLNAARKIMLDKQLLDLFQSGLDEVKKLYLKQTDRQWKKPQLIEQ